jgi:hypothetical protein
MILGSNIPCYGNRTLALLVPSKEREEVTLARYSEGLDKAYKYRYSSLPDILVLFSVL